MRTLNENEIHGVAGANAFYTPEQWKGMHNDASREAKMNGGTLGVIASVTAYSMVGAISAPLAPGAAVLSLCVVGAWGYRTAYKEYELWPPGYKPY